MILQRIIFFLLALFFMSCSDGDSGKSKINIWHQMHYENRKVLREICDEYEHQNSNLQINLTYRETENSAQIFNLPLWEAPVQNSSMVLPIRWDHLLL